jgi:ribosomal protein S18 acetylase RimI-like enzyme
MGPHPLDNPIWTALTTSQADFAEVSGLARKFVPDVGPLAAFERPTREAYASLVKLVRVGTGAGIFLEAPANQADIESAGFKILEQDSLLQMIYSDCELPARATGFVKLATTDSPEMVALATMMKPGPFGTRTHELGIYIGVRREGQLAAMAGERMRMPGFTEISAVCTHPHHSGHGYATALMVELIEQIRRRKEIPILHVRSSNTHAIGLYRRIGFADRRHFHFTVIGKSAA